MSDEKRNEQIRQLEEEGDYAADYLEELLDIVDFGGDIEIDVENDRAAVAIVGEDGDSSLDRLVGDDAEVLGHSSMPRRAITSLDPAQTNRTSGRESISGRYL